MATTYNVRFFNNTNGAYFFVIYQAHPKAPGLKSVAFQVRAIPPKGKADATWDMTFGTAITDFEPNSKAWTGQQIQNVQLKKAYEVKLFRW